MHDTQQSNDERHLLLNMILIVLETLFSFIVKNDSILKLQSKKFVHKQVCIKVSSYLPFFEFYVLFSPNGLLFERISPINQTQLALGLNLMDVLKIFVLGQESVVQEVPIEGPDDLVDDLRSLLLSLSLPRLLSDWQQWLLPSQYTSPDDDTSSSRRVAPFLKKIELQRQEINHLKVELSQHKFRLQQAQVRQRNIIYLMGSVCFILLVALFYMILIF